jgi:hypothetical protein
MTLEQLRLKHPRLVYKTYTITHSDQSITISHEFSLEPDIVFRPNVTIPYNRAYTLEVEARLAPYAFNLGLIEAISHWKAACPKEFVVEAGVLSEGQIRFWYDLFIHGLGEFFFRNQIDFTKPDFFKIHVSAEAEVGMPWFSRRQGPDHGSVRNPSSAKAVTTLETTRLPASALPTSDLVLVGGGKDSAVTLGIMKQSDRTIQTMILESTSNTKAALENIRAAGLSDPIIVRRTIDPKLLELNKEGYLNGHTPFSAYLAFLGITVAALNGHENVIVSNEKSASEGNVMYKGLEVNHQYSKSFRFEQAFRAYVLNAFEGPANYFSLLRPLNDVQISLIFSKHPEFFTTFRSCNVGSKHNTWCGACPKCAFTYLTLSPFLSQEQMVVIFGGDLLTREEIIDHVRALVGLTPVKPFECVGTRDEAKLAVVLAVTKYIHESREVPEGLLKVKSDLNLSESDVARLKESVIDNWGDTYNLPPEHLTILRKTWERARTDVKTE